MLTTETLAEELNVDRTNVTKWVREGRILAVLLPRTWGIPETVLQHVREHGVPPRDTHPRPIVHRAAGETEGHC